MFLVSYFSYRYKGKSRAKYDIQFPISFRFANRGNSSFPPLAHAGFALCLVSLLPILDRACPGLNRNDICLEGFGAVVAIHGNLCQYYFDLPARPVVQR